MRVPIARTLVLAALLVPAAASARTDVLTLPRGFAPFGDPQAALVGDHLVYREPRVFSDTVLRVVGPAGQDRPLASLGEGGASLAGSDSLLAVVHGNELLTGPAEGPLTAVSHCARGVPAVDGSNVAYVEDGCGAHAVVVNSAEPRRIELPEGASVDSLSLAGRYVAFHSGSEIVVYDWQSGTERMRVPAESENTCGTSAPNGRPTESFCGLAVQSDGTVAELTGRFIYVAPGPTRYEQGGTFDSCGGTISWLSPDDPHAHAIWSKACVDERVRIDAGRVLFATRTIVGIGVVDLAGNERDLGEPNEVYAFDGTHVFVNEEGCLSAKVV